MSSRFYITIPVLEATEEMARRSTSKKLSNAVKRKINGEYFYVLEVEKDFAYSSVIFEGLDWYNSSRQVLKNVEKRVRKIVAPLVDEQGLPIEGNLQAALTLKPSFWSKLKFWS